MTKRKNATATLTKIAILSAIAFLLMFLDFPLPFLPPFYKLDFSEVAVLVGGFALGPGAAAAIEGIKVILNILFQGTDTAYVGEIASFIIGCALACPAAYYYKKNKTRAGALKSLLIGAGCMIVAGAVINYFVLLPAYSYFYGLPMEVLVGMGSALIPMIKDTFTFVLFATVPFNLIKSILVAVITMLLYKHVSPILHRGN